MVGKEKTGMKRKHLLSLAFYAVLGTTVFGTAGLNVAEAAEESHDDRPEELEDEEIYDDRPEETEGEEIHDDRPEETEGEEIHDDRPEELEGEEIHDDRPEGMEGEEIHDDRPEGLGEPDGPDPNGPGGQQQETEPVEADEGMANLAVAEQGFICLVTEEGTVYWDMAANTFDRLASVSGIGEDLRYVKLEVVPDNGEAYPYLYPEKDWKLLIYEEEAPDWLTDDMKESVMDAFGEWKDAVYVTFDYEAFRAMTAADTTEAAPGEGYEPTEEEMAAFREYVILEDSLCTYLKTSVNDTLAAAYGPAIAADIWNYMNNSVGNEAEHAANLGGLIREMGLSNVGSVQKDFYGCVAGHFAELENWNYYAGDIEGYPYECAYFLWSHGLSVSQDSNKLWRLHSADGGEIYAEIPDEEVSVSKAFACVAGEDGSLYWGRSLDNTDSIRRAYDLAADGAFVNVRVEPVLDYEKAELTLPDGNNPDVTKYFPYFDSTTEWKLTVLDDETPEWFDEGAQEAVMAACDEWKADVLDSFRFEEASAVFTEETQKVAAYTEEDVALLREWAIVWNSLKDQQMDPTTVIKASGHDNVGSSVWDQADEYFLSTWRVQHSDCPGAVVSNGYWGRLGITDRNDYISSVNDTLANSVSDAMEALTGKFFEGAEDWEWSGYQGEADGYPYESAAELITRNLVPCTDGTNWYLSSGMDAEIVFEISEEELLGNE